MGKKANFRLGVIWFILSLVVSIGNDVIQKHLGTNLPPEQVTFLRFCFASVALIPFMAYFGKKSFTTSRPLLHAARGALLFGGIALWCFSLNIVKLPVVTTFSFTIPLFTLVLAKIFLKENVTWQRWLATLAGFAGIAFVLDPGTSSFEPASLWIILAAVCFASLDVLNKRFVIQETMLSMLFYGGLATALIAAYPAYAVWVAPSLEQLALLALLGCGANLILFCLLKAFAQADASALAPFRYTELILSALAAYLLWNETLNVAFFVGVAIIIPTSMFVIYAEKNTKS